MSVTVVDGKYYEAVRPSGLSERWLISARKRMFDDFARHMEPTRSDQILDVGVSDVVNDAANALERMYSTPGNITACGLGEGAEFRRAYPAIRYVQIAPNTALPFERNRFEVATANAVLEHVGSRDNQVLFVSELCRVARRVFITVPNRFFPVEHHTALPLAHWQAKAFRLACRATDNAQWAQEANLILMTRKKLWRLASHISGHNITVGYTGLRWGPFSSNLFLAIR